MLARPLAFWDFLSSKKQEKNFTCGEKHTLLEKLRVYPGPKKPELYVVDDEKAQAFATPFKTRAICKTRNSAGSYRQKAFTSM
jgi:hypothetical protein